MSDLKRIKEILCEIKIDLYAGILQIYKATYRVSKIEYRFGMAYYLLILHTLHISGGKTLAYNVSS